jgi:YHS domain-containing protein
MANVSNLQQRIRAEFAASQNKLKQFQEQQIEANVAREQRLEQLEQKFDQLREVWRPRLEALAEEFGERTEVKPTVTPGRRQAAFSFKSPLARIELRFSATADTDVRNLILSYDLDILPILMRFERHAEIECPLDQIDVDVIGQWFDDRIVEFVKTYLSLHENEYYLKGHMVEDPVASVRFPDFAAGATREADGKTYYFISEETAEEFDKQRG